MLDLHTHFLPGVDDGPRTLAEALDILRGAVADGTQVVVATPHSRDVWESRSVASLQGLFREVSEAARQAGIPIELRLGMENRLEPDLPQRVEEGAALCLGGSRYILVELPFSEYPPYVDETLFALQVRGLSPVIAHPERNANIQQRPEILRALVERGILGQITGDSLRGTFGRGARSSARTLLRQRLGHIIASDTHSPNGRRSPHLSQGLAAAAKVVGEEQARSMVEATPKAVLKSELVTPTPLPPPGEGSASF